MRTIIAVMAAVLVLGPGVARAADEWGIENEKVMRFEAKVVDILCELTGDCPANCGDGKRQLGLLMDNGVLVLAAKNFDPFAGTVTDLIDFCGKGIVADGLAVNNPQMPIFALQFKRLGSDGKWSRANWFSKEWGKTHAGVNASRWFRHDGTVKQLIDDQGVFGIPGLEPEE